MVYQERLLQNFLCHAIENTENTVANSVSAHLMERLCAILSNIQQLASRI